MKSFSAGQKVNCRKAAREAALGRVPAENTETRAPLYPQGVCDIRKALKRQRLSKGAHTCEIPLAASPLRGLHAYTVLSGIAAKNLL